MYDAGGLFYVFVNAISPMVRQLSFAHYGNENFYRHYRKHIDRGEYDTWLLYGLPAFNVDRIYTQFPAPAIKLEIHIGEGINSIEQLPVEPWVPPAPEPKLSLRQDLEYEDVPDDDPDLLFAATQRPPPPKDPWKGTSLENSLDYDVRIRHLFTGRPIPGKPGRKRNPLSATPAQLRKMERKEQEWREKKINEAYLRRMIAFEMRKEKEAGDAIWTNYKEEARRRLKEDKAEGRTLTLEDLKDAMEGDPYYDDPDHGKPWVIDPYFLDLE
jgi:hypothetical protein